MVLATVYLWWIYEHLLILFYIINYKCTAVKQQILYCAFTSVLGTVLMGGNIGWSSDGCETLNRRGTKLTIFRGFNEKKPLKWLSLVAEFDWIYYLVDHKLMPLSNRNMPVLSRHYLNTHRHRCMIILQSITSAEFFT